MASPPAPSRQILARGTCTATLPHALRSVRLPAAPAARSPFREKLCANLSFERWNRPLGNPVAGRGRNVQRPARGRAFHARHDADNGGPACRFHGLGNVGKTSELEKV